MTLTNVESKILTFFRYRDHYNWAPERVVKIFRSRNFSMEYFRSFRISPWKKLPRSFYWSLSVLFYLSWSRFKFYQLMERCLASSSYGSKKFSFLINCHCSKTLNVCREHFHQSRSCAIQNLNGILQKIFFTLIC